MKVGNHGQTVMKVNQECQKKRVDQIYKYQILYLQTKLAHLNSIN